MTIISPDTLLQKREPRPSSVNASGILATTRCRRCENLITAHDGLDFSKMFRVSNQHVLI